MAGKYDFESKLGALKIKDCEEVDAFMDSYPTCRTTTKVLFGSIFFTVILNHGPAPLLVKKMS